MVSTSTVVMFVLMYANTYDADHFFWSETRFWMMFVMGAMMMVVMLLFMWGMYKDRTKNFIILGVGAIVFAIALWLVRSQTTVDDTEYMAAMIPHHSIAIMTSERASLKDPRVRELAQAIIVAPMTNIIQKRVSLQNTSSMSKLLAYIRKNMITVEVDTIAMNRQ